MFSNNSMDELTNIVTLLSTISVVAQCKHLDVFLEFRGNLFLPPATKGAMGLALIGKESLT